MVCKEDVCLWFRSLNGPKRIDLMCGLLHLCLPLELRFVASCVEELAKKDFLSLREAELRSNSPKENKNLSDLSESRTISTIITHLALLNSHNIVCANLLHDTLDRMIRNKHDQDLLRKLAKDPQSMEELLLMLTMAVNHPAFSFIQKQNLSGLLERAEKITKEIVLPPQVQGCKLGDSDDTGSHHGSIGGCSCQPKSFIDEPVGIRQIECKGFQWNGQGRQTYHLQVTWNNGVTTDTWKTYTELAKFHQQLLNVFPKESAAHKQERHIPFFPSDKGIARELTEQLRKYFRQLSSCSLPPNILQCDLVMQCFSPPKIQKETTDGESKFQGNSYMINNTSFDGPPMKPLVISSMSTASPSPTASSTANSSAAASPNTAHQYNRPSSVLMHSPGSAHGVQTPVVQHSNAASPQPSNRDNIAQWLKSIRLHKYTDKLTRFTFSELHQLSDEKLTELGLVPGARKKLQQQLRILRNPPNGVISITNRSDPPSPSRLLLPEPRYPRRCGQTSITSSIDSSPPGSEFGSPPATPPPISQGEAQENLSYDEAREEPPVHDPRQSLQDYLTSPSHEPVPAVASTQMYVAPSVRFDPKRGIALAHSPVNIDGMPVVLEPDVTSVSVVSHDIQLKGTPPSRIIPPMGLIMEGARPPSSLRVQTPVHVEAVVTVPVTHPMGLPSETITSIAPLPISHTPPVVEESSNNGGTVYMVTTTNVTYTITQSFAPPTLTKPPDPVLYSSHHQPAEVHSATPPLTHPPPATLPNTTLIYACSTSTPTPNVPAMVHTRSSCKYGCSCNCHMPAPVTIGAVQPTPNINTTSTPVNFMWPPPSSIYTGFPTPHVGVTQHTGAIIGHNVACAQFSQAVPGVNIGNGLTPELAHNTQANYPMMIAAAAAAQGHHHGHHPGFMHPLPLPGGMIHMNGAPHLAGIYSGKLMKNKEAMCHNCGGAGHWAQECQEPTMDTMNHSGRFQLNFKPTTEVE